MFIYHSVRAETVQKLAASCLGTAAFPSDTRRRPTSLKVLPSGTDYHPTCRSRPWLRPVSRTDSYMTVACKKGFFEFLSDYKYEETKRLRLAFGPNRVVAARPSIQL